MKKTILALLSLIAILAPVCGIEFSPEAVSLCATDTAVFVTSVENAGDSLDTFTVSLSGDGAKWAVAAPTGFSLAPGELENVYVYVTPGISALAGDYELKATIAGMTETGEGTINIKVLDCHSASFTAEDTEEEICSATRATYSLQLNNTGKYTENFAISLAGLPAEWSTLSEELITLNAGSAKEVLVYSNPPADQTGDFRLTVTAASQNSKATATQLLALKSKPCYDFSARADVNYLSFCENSEAKIPIAIENAGSVDNSYELSVEGPMWATMENVKLDIPAGQAAFANLVLFPRFGVTGDFDIKVTATPAKGTLTTQTVVSHVKSCYSVDLKLSTNADVVCPNTEKAYAVSLVNTGEFDSRYGITVSGPDFASADESFVDLKAGEAASFNLLVAPKNISGEERTISIKAEAQDASKAAISAELKLEIAPLENCFGVEATSALTQVYVMPGEPALIPIVVNNKGLENSTYNLEVSGNGASFVQLNPASLVLGGKTAKSVYAYVAVPEGTAKDSYKVTVAARLKDQASVMSTASFDILLSEEPKEEKEKETVSEKLEIDKKTTAVRKTVVNFFTAAGAKLKILFAKLKDRIKKPAPAKEEEKPAAEIEKANETEEVAAVEEEINVSAELFENASAHLSPAAKEKLADILKKNVTPEEENKTVAVEKGPTIIQRISKFFAQKMNRTRTAEEEAAGPTVKERVQTNIRNLSTAAGTAAVFLKSTTYFVPNWLFIVIVILVVACLSYLLRRKDLIEKFNKFLEEEEEKPKEEATPEQPKNNKKKQQPSAQDFLDKNADK